MTVLDNFSCKILSKPAPLPMDGESGPFHIHNCQDNTGQLFLSDSIDHNCQYSASQRFPATITPLSGSWDHGVAASSHSGLHLNQHELALNYELNNT